MAPSQLLSLAAGCHLKEESTREWRLVHRGEEVSITAPPSAVASALRQLLEGESTLDELASQVSRRAGYDGFQRLYRLLFELHEGLLLRRLVRAEVILPGTLAGELLASWLPLVAACPFSVAPLGTGEFVLSRFAYLRRLGDRMAIESPRSLARVVVHHGAAAAFLTRLSSPTTVEELCADVDPLLGVVGTRDFCELLHQAGLLASIDADGLAEEDRGSRGWWEFHDLLAHSRGRAGRHDTPYGGVYRKRGLAAPLPALKPRMAGKTVELLRPNPDLLARRDPSLSTVVARRRSRRDHGEPAISLQDLSELLWRAARAEKAVAGRDYEVARRPYPGGGAAWELELYLAVERCRGLAAGLYHYRPGDHQLTRLSARTAEVDRLLSAACKASMVEEVQVLVIFAARFGRLSWKYASMAYATVLKDVGVLLQNLYLSATAMELSACAIGGGNADLFAAAAGTDYYEESSVGEMILGRG